MNSHGIRVYSQEISRVIKNIIRTVLRTGVGHNSLNDSCYAVKNYYARKPNAGLHASFFLFSPNTVSLLENIFEYYHYFIRTGLLLSGIIIKFIWT